MPEDQGPSKLDKLKSQMYSRFKQPLSRPRRELQELENDAPTDWTHESPAAVPVENLDEPAVATIDVQKSFAAKYSWPVLFLIISSIIFLLIGGAAITYLLTGSNTITSRKIDVSLNGPRTLEGGEEMSLQVQVRNNNNATLEYADLVVTYPQGTREPSNFSASLETQRISLGTIEPGGVRNGTIRAVLFGKNGEIKDISVELEYRLANSSGLFSTNPVTYSTTLSSSALDIAFATNSQAIAGQRMDILATVTSNAQKTLRDVVVHPTFPFGFTVENTSPELGTNALWELGDLAPGESREIRIIGTLDGQSGDERVFRLLAGTRSTTSSKEVEVVLADFEERVVVERPFLDMTLSYDGKTNDEYVAHPGVSMPVTLRWRNNLPVGLTDVAIAVTLGGAGLDQYNVSVDRGFYRSIDSVAIWDKSTTEGALSQVAPGEEGTVTLRITPKKTAQLAGVEQPTITFELHAAGQRLAESDVPETLQSSVREAVKVATRASVVASALYFDNPLGSVGPLPPKVNKETTYGMLWEITNSTSALTDATLTAVLPPYVRWVGSTSPAAEQVTYNENDRTITWRVGKVLPNTGVGSTPPRRVVFAIGLVPSTSQVGTSPALIQQQRLTGVDAFSEESVDVRVDEITTALHESRFADYYGIVSN